MNLNKAMIIGRVGKDPEVNYVKEDLPVARFSVATNESYKGKDGEWRENTEWHNVVAWRNRAKYCETAIRKGSLVFIEGKLQTRQWEGQDGNKRYTTEIVADTIRSLEKKSDGEVAPKESSEKPANTNTNNEPAEKPETSFPENFNPNEDGSDDLPF